MSSIKARQWIPDLRKAQGKMLSPKQICHYKTMSERHVSIKAKVMHNKIMNTSTRNLSFWYVFQSQELSVIDE
jgi:hypothetical protein